MTTLTLTQTLASELRAAGYHAVIGYDPVTGFHSLHQPGESPAIASEIFGQLGLPLTNGSAPAGIDLFSETLQRISVRTGEPIALIAGFASRLVVRNDALSAPEHQAFTRALVLSQQTRSRPHGPQGRPFFNTIVWVVDKEGDLPDWLVIDNPRIVTFRCPGLTIAPDASSPLPCYGAWKDSRKPSHARPMRPSMRSLITPKAFCSLI